MKQNLMILVLMVAAVFSVEARKLLQISAQAECSGGVPCDGEHGGASCD